MNSTIKFDLIEGYRPAITMTIADTEAGSDLRDKVANGFIEALGYDSSWLRIERVTTPDLPSGRGGRFTILPVSDINALLRSVKDRLRDMPGVPIVGDRDMAGEGFKIAGNGDAVSFTMKDPFTAEIIVSALGSFRIDVAQLVKGLRKLSII